MTVYLHTSIFCHESIVRDETLLSTGILEDLLRQAGNETKNFLLCLASLLPHGLSSALSGVETGMVVTTDMGAMEYYETFFDSIAAGDLQPNAFKGAIPCFTASVAALHFGFRGPTITIIDTNPYSLSALHQARRCIESGWCDAVVTGGFSASSRTKNRLCESSNDTDLTNGYWAALLSRDRVCGGSVATVDVTDVSLFQSLTDVRNASFLFQVADQ